jgi:hypothetical protein
MAGLFVPLEASYTEDPKVQSVSEHAELLFVRSLCYCKLHWQTDGFIHHRALHKVAPFTDEVMPQELAGELEAAGLWTPVENGWRVTAWLRHNPSNEDIEEKRRRENDRKAEWRRKRDAERDASRDNGTRESRDEDATDTQAQAQAQSSLSRSELVEQALDLLAERDIENHIASGGEVRNRRAYLRAVRASRVADCASLLHELAQKHPDWTAVDLADEVEADESPVTVLRAVKTSCDECGWQQDVSPYPHGPVHAEWRAEVAS